MVLKTYLQQLNIRQEAFSGVLEISQGHLSELAAGRKHPSPDLAARIEAATHGAVTAAELLAHLIPPGYSLVRVEGGESVEQIPPSPVDGAVGWSRRTTGKEGVGCHRMNGSRRWKGRLRS